MAPVTDKAASDHGDWRELSRVSYRRSLVLMALGALIGLGLAGYALFTAKGTSTLLTPPEDVAMVNQQPISRSDFDAQVQSLYAVDPAHATPAQRQKVLDDMIREELFVQRGQELDVAAVDPEVRAAMVNAVEQEIAADAITSHPSEAKLRDYYEAHRAKYASEGMMTLVDMVFPTASPDVVRQAAEALRAGTSAAQVAGRFHGRDSGRVNGEEFYFAARIHLGDKAFDAARALPPGGVSGPMSESDGVHLLHMIKNTPPAPMDFAQARERVVADYLNEAIKRLQSGDERFFRKRANILIAKDQRR
jgi:parvulin-like peptidyl-prolyl isomerase